MNQSSEVILDPLPFRLNLKLIGDKSSLVSQTGFVRLTAGVKFKVNIL